MENKNPEKENMENRNMGSKNPENKNLKNSHIETCSCENTKLAVIAIVVEQEESVRELNELLHNYSGYILGRMGIPYRNRGVSLISVAMDAPADIISALSGRLGRIKGVSAKVAYSKL